MTTVAMLRELGAEPRLYPDGRLVVAGLNSLPSAQAARAVALARQHKEELLTELQSEGETPEGIPPLAPEQFQEVQDWPPETQRVFVALLDHFESKGFVLSEAEALAYATMQELKRRRGGLVKFTSPRMPGELALAVGTARGVFGCGVKAEWVPASASTTQGREPSRENNVCCCDCQHFQPGTGDVQHALGLCRSDAWDKNRGQWPNVPHRCSAYTANWGICNDNH